MIKRKNVIFTAIVFFGLYILLAYNQLVTKDQGVQSQWAQVETQYQRRFDLIPNLVSTAKKYMDHEHSIFTELAAARALYSQGPVDTKVKAAAQMDTALSKLLAIAENYPDLKANQTMMQLMDELAGTENRVSVERMRFNQAVQVYNTQIRQFPRAIIAKIFGFGSKNYLESEAAAKKAPVVSELFAK